MYVFLKSKHLHKVNHQNSRFILLFRYQMYEQFQQIDLSCTASNLTSKLIFLYVNRVANKFQTPFPCNSSMI